MTLQVYGFERADIPEQREYVTLGKDLAKKCWGVFSFSFQVSTHVIDLIVLSTITNFLNRFPI